MKQAIVLYQSKYGATKQYADWLAEALSCPAIETKKAALSEVQSFDVIILGGGIYAGGISGISFLKKHYAKLKDKKILVFAVGASPYDEKAMVELRARHFKGELAGLPLFYCRGAWNEARMSWSDRMLCGMLKKAVAKKSPSDYEPWEAALMEAIGSEADWTDRESLAPLLELVRSE